MTGRFLVKDIALQAGVGSATVDRVLNKRAGVHPQTIRRVQQAVRDLELQEGMLGLKGRKFIVDIIMEAPRQFQDAVRCALAEELPSLMPAVFRVRQWMEPFITDDQLRRRAEFIAKRGTHGVLLMCSDSRGASDVVGTLSASSIPVITMATDLPSSARTAYVGMDNFQGGRTAALLLGRWLHDRPASVLITIRNPQFRGEEDREIGFRRYMATRHPELALHRLAETSSRADFRDLVRSTLANQPAVRGIYSIGGNNRMIADVLGELGVRVEVFLAHDLDADNLELLKAETLTAVLHHDLRRDLREAFRAIMRCHRALSASCGPDPSPIIILTSANLQ